MQKAESNGQVKGNGTRREEWEMKRSQNGSKTVELKEGA